MTRQMVPIEHVLPYLRTKQDKSDKERIAALEIGLQALKHKFDKYVMQERVGE